MPTEHQTKTALPLPLCNRLPGTAYTWQGFLNDYLTGVTEQWLKVAPLANPAMLEMLRDRDRQPLRNLVPWAGELAGKYLTSAVQVLRLTRDLDLREVIRTFVAHLVSLQADDGYLGPWPQGHHLTGKAPNVMNDWGTWDAWGHYHILLGLLLWYEESGDPATLDCARRIGDLICKEFLNTGQRLVDTGSTEMNLSVLHGLCLLYRTTGTPVYLEMARQIVDEFAAQGPEGPLAGDYVHTALAGQEFYQTPKPRWESLHCVMGLAELYWLTGDERYRQAVEHIWWSIVKLDRHNNGGFSSGEKAQGNPYHPGAIETCCTVAWIALGVEMLRLTASAVVADELELATLNSVIGFHSHTGRWVTYNTPMDGVRKASAHDIVFQAREGSPELNCCSVNGPRGLGLLGDWALMADAEGLIINWYGPSTMTAQVSEVAVTLQQATDYPRAGHITLNVTPAQPISFALKLRIPHWSSQTQVSVNGQRVTDVVPGRYLVLTRTWQPGDRVEIHLDMALHFWVGEEECSGKASIYRGPILLTYDRRFNEMAPDDLPLLDAKKLYGSPVEAQTWIEPILLLEVTAEDGRKVRLCDFGSAGEGGAPYRSWLPVEHVHPVAFSHDNPLRSGRALAP
jgi:DUF1680 family protein